MLLRLQPYDFVIRYQPGKSMEIADALSRLSLEEKDECPRSDNGPHYSGQAFQEFAIELGFQHVTSSPHYPVSNGVIESQV